MKKTLLFISILVCFCQAFAGGANSIVKHPAFVSPVQNDLYSVVAVNYPHTELEVNYHSASANSNCRPQNLQGFTGTAETEHFDSHHPFAKTIETFSQVWCKQYLFHIYPSHNFW